VRPAAALAERSSHGASNPTPFDSLDKSPCGDVVCHLVVTRMAKARPPRLPSGAKPTGKKGAAGQRDREKTRSRILAALGRLLARKGGSSLGINAISREAKVDKVLIYRYFGGIDQLYRAFALEGNTFPSLEEVAEGRLNEFPELPPAELAKVIILGFGRAIRRRPVTREMMRWELQERNALTDALAKERENQSRQWLALAPDMHGADLPAVASVLVAAQVFLTLRSKTTDTYNGIDLRSQSGWKRIEDAVALLSDLFFRHVAENPAHPEDKKSGH
jgi:AcrR family transcriptional regulator